MGGSRGVFKFESWSRCLGTWVTKLAFGAGGAMMKRTFYVRDRQGGTRALVWLGGALSEADIPAFNEDYDHNQA